MLKRVITSGSTERSRTSTQATRDAPTNCEKGCSPPEPEPAGGSGVWGAIAMTVQTAAGLLGMRTALAALEAGEDRLLALYTHGLGGRDARARRIMDEALLEQRRTLHLCKALREYVKTPS